MRACRSMRGAFRARFRCSCATSTPRAPISRPIARSSCTAIARTRCPRRAPRAFSLRGASCAPARWPAGLMPGSPRGGRPKPCYSLCPRRRASASFPHEAARAGLGRCKEIPMTDLFSLANRTALITGGSRGIGRMIAAGFLKQGARGYISSRKAADCDRAARELSAHGECFSLPADVSTLEGLNALVAAYGAREVKLDILVNNAGAAWGETFDAFSEKGWDKVVDLNLKTPFFLTQALHEMLKAAASAERPAKVINVASIDGISVNPQETYSYAASKAVLIQLTRRMALRLAQDDVVVSAIAPGAFASDMNRAARDHGDEIAKRIPARRIDLPRVGRRRLRRRLDARCRRRRHARARLKPRRDPFAGPWT